MKCNICPRNCNIDRNISIGYCGAKNLKVALIMRHMWEEPIISGKNGSGTIFFSHCSLKCCYCQNYEISHLGVGQTISVEKLAEYFKILYQSGVNNINLVTPTHYKNEIISALNIYHPPIPIVWNSSGYETAKDIADLKGYVDIFLVDFKYFDNELAIKYSKAPKYFEFASSAIIQMRKNQPKDIIKNGLMKKGLIIRHMILPSEVKNSISVLNWIKDNLGNKTYVSIMSQYTPCFKAKEFKKLQRKIFPLEYKIVINKAMELGFDNAFIQDLSSASDSFIPEFETDNIIKFNY